MLRVIGAGFGRTGTFSLKTALETLGFGPCYHMFEVFNRPEHDALWEAAARGGDFDWERIFAGYEAAVDWPACSFYASLMARYPEAKVVLTVRDPESWYESARTTIHSRAADSDVTALSAGDRMRTHIIWQGVFGSRFDDRDHALAVFRRHVDDVKRTVPADRLLVYDVREGWEPLCRFLGVAVPENTAFPRLNTGEDFRRRLGATGADLAE